MKSRILMAISIVAVLLVFATSPSYARVHENLNWGSQINQGECPNGTLVINITMKVINDADSGFGGYWALDNYVKHIQVIQTSPAAQDTGVATFCATASYQGDFTTYAGTSPSGNSTVGAGVVGTFQGGYIVSNFTGVLKATPDYKTRGSIGTFNYNCDSTGCGSGNVFDWTAAYFSTNDLAVGSNDNFWGWTYHAGNNGSWVNSSGGSTGDVTGN